MSEDAFAVEWQPDVGARRKLRFEPVDENWLRVEYEWNGCQWCEVGDEFIDDVELVSDAEIVA